MSSNAHPKPKAGGIVDSVIAGLIVEGAVYILGILFGRDKEKNADKEESRFSRRGPVI